MLIFSVHSSSCLGGKVGDCLETGLSPSRIVRVLNVGVGEWRKKLHEQTFFDSRGGRR